MLTLLLREITVHAVPGAMAELGVYRGASACLLHHYCPERKLYLFDTFSGFTAADLTKESMPVAYNQTRQFADTDVALVLRAIEPRTPNVTPVPGSFPTRSPRRLETKPSPLCIWMSISKRPPVRDWSSFGPA